MIDQTTLWRFVLTFSWAFEVLQFESKELWRESELKWARLLRESGAKIPGTARIIQDRFAAVFRDFFRNELGDGNRYFAIQQIVKERIFSDWKDW